MVSTFREIPVDPFLSVLPGGLAVRGNVVAVANWESNKLHACYIMCCRSEELTWFGPIISQLLYSG